MKSTKDNLTIEFKNNVLSVDDNDHVYSRCSYRRERWACLNCRRRTLWADGEDLECGTHVVCTNCGYDFWFHEPTETGLGHPFIANLKKATRTQAGRAANHLPD